MARSCRTNSEKKIAQLDTALSALEGLSLSVPSTCAEDDDDNNSTKTASIDEKVSNLRLRSSRSQTSHDLPTSQEKIRRIFPSIPQSLRRVSQMPKNSNCRCRCHGESLKANKACSQCVGSRQKSPWRFRPYDQIGQQQDGATSSDGGAKGRRGGGGGGGGAEKGETCRDEVESLRTLMAAAKATECELDDLNLSLRSTRFVASWSSSLNSSSSCGAQARSREECITVDELAAYFDDFLNLPRKMSPLAESMYA
uniref:Oxidative stress-responsive serine-rich protein 1 n=1 Tax=Plectus sambesii TaxID=2011161 RepID=A0A914W930_9BILA